MSAYKNFINDFPRRCREVLDFSEKFAHLKQLEVTLTLIVASSGFVIPFERLDSKHPSRDNETYSNAACALNKILDQPFKDSPLWSDSFSSWTGGKLKSINGDPDSWEDLGRRKPFLPEKKVSTVLKVIRNALAHGNIFTFNNPIEALIFIRCSYDNDKVVNGYSFIYVEPKQFKEFLKLWFDFLETLDIDQDLALDILKQAA